MVLAVCPNHPFRSTLLYLSVTTHHVMVANAELKASLAMPGIYLGNRGCLVGSHCRTMNHDEGYRPHDCTAIVPRTVVITVATNRNTLATLFQFTFTIKFLQIKLILSYLYLSFLSSLKETKQRKVQKRPELRGRNTNSSNHSKNSLRSNSFSYFVVQIAFRNPKLNVDSKNFHSYKYLFVRNVFE